MMIGHYIACMVTHKAVNSRAATYFVFLNVYTLFYYIVETAGVQLHINPLTQFSESYERALKVILLCPTSTSCDCVGGN